MTKSKRLPKKKERKRELLSLYQRTVVYKKNSSIQRNNQEANNLELGVGRGKPCSVTNW